jgi:hypothetical protein
MSNLSNVRPVYIGPWRKGTLAQLSTFILEVPAAPYLALIDRGEVVFPDIHSKDWAADKSEGRHGIF